MIDRIPLSYLAGVVTGALAAACVFVGLMLGWTLWIIRSID